MALHVLIAGATGALGGHVIQECRERGHAVRALVNRTPLRGAKRGIEIHRANALDPAQLENACDGVDAVFSCLGASVMPDLRRGRRSFDRVDFPANRNLITEATRAGVNRFVYVGVAGHETMGHLRYVAAHERVVRLIEGSGLTHTVIRPPGFFSAFKDFVGMARMGFLPVIGSGSARTNPIHGADLAKVCVNAIEGLQSSITVGGPRVVTRNEIAELAFEAVGKPPRIRKIPPGFPRLMAPIVRPLNPRVADLALFYADVSTRDLVVSGVGTRTLEGYFDEIARRRGHENPFSRPD